MPYPAALVDIHRRLNRTTRGSWGEFAEHRERVMRLVPTPDTDEGRVAVLGAGNCNDVDLHELARRFSEVHLVDIDEAALRSAVKRSSTRARAVTRPHQLDLSGTLGSLQSWRSTPPTPEALREVASAASETARAALPGPFEAVISSLVLSQIVHTAMEVLGRSHPSLRHASLAGVVAHLRIALDLLSAGGSLVLVVDAFARPRDVMAQLLGDGRPEDLLLRMESQGLCLPGTEVGFVTHAIERFAPAASLALTPAWLWQPGEHRTHLVYALVVVAA